MKTIILILLLIFSSANAEPNIPQVEKIIKIFKDKNIENISKMVEYPLKRENPISSVKTSYEFLLRFNEIFDKKIIQMIINSDITKDWSKVGANTMFNNGDIWLNSNGKIIAINYQSNEEKIIKKHLLSLEKTRLHNSLSEFSKPILSWKTKKFLVRIDELEDNKYRYAGWSSKKTFVDKPDIILSNGIITYDGSAGNHFFTFKNGKYIYKVYVTVLGKSKNDYGRLDVFKNKKLILSEKALNDK